MNQWMADPGAGLAHLLFFLVALTVAFTVGNRLRVLRQTMVAFVLHMVIAGAIYGSSGLWAPDAVHYDRLGLAFQEYWFHGGHTKPFVTSGKEGIPSLLGVLYELFGHHPFLGVIVNVLLATLVVPVVASTSRVVRIDAGRAAWLTACLPPLLLWGSVLLRESASWLMLALIVRGLAGLSAGEPRPWLNWCAVILPFFPLFTVRGTAAILVGGAALFTFSLTAKNRLLPILLGVLAVVVAAPSLMSTLNSIAGGYDVDAINRQREALSRSATSSFEVEQYDGVGGVLLSSPMALLRGLAGPFPWELPALGIFLIMDTLVWWVIVALIVVGIARMPERRHLWSLLIPAITILAVLSVTSGNYGTMTRLRYQAAVMMLPLAGHGLERLLARRRTPQVVRPAHLRARAGMQRTLPAPDAPSTPGSRRSAPLRPRQRPWRPPRRRTV